MRLPTPVPPLRAASWLVAALLLVAPAAAQIGGNQAGAVLHARQEGDVVRVAIEVEIEPRWHLYHTELGPPDAVGQPTAVALGPDEVRWSEVRFPEPHRYEQPGIGRGGRDTWILGHEDRIVLYAAGRAVEGAEDVAGRVTAEIRGLTCLDDGSCIPYRESLEARGTGPDASFAAFPADLEAPPAPAPPEPEPAVERKVSGPADAHLFARRDGELLRVAIEVEIEPGWHLYHTELGPPDAVGQPTVVELAPESVAWSPVRFPEPQRFEQEVGSRGIPTWILGHEGRIVLHAVGRAPEGLEPSAVSAEVRGLICKESCIPFRATLPSEGGGADALFADFPDDLEPPAPSGDGGKPESDDAAAAGAEPIPPPPVAGVAGAPQGVDYDAVAFPEFRPRSGLGAEGLGGTERGLLVWLAVAFLAGMILNVMPCVLPVISIKVLSFVQQAGEDRRRVLSLGIAFASGILVVFLVLAALAIGVGQAWGEQFQSAGFVVAMIAIVFGFSLSLFGVYDIGVPSQVGTVAATMRREGIGDAFFKGMLATVLATPCSGPFLGTTLTWTLAQPALVVLAIFSALGVGMAFPYVVLTANPRLLRVLPRPGPWMETFKQAMGFVLLATVVYLMTILRQDLLLYTVVFLGFVALALWLWGRYAAFGAPARRKLVTVAVALLALGGGGYFSFGTLRNLYTHESDLWEAFDPERFQAYLDDGRNVFLDFTAEWCPTCKMNEKLVYDSDEVREVMRARGVIPVKADMTHDTPYTDMVERLLRDLGGSAIPYLAIFPGDDPLSPYVKPDLVTRREILEILESLPSDGRPRPIEFASR